MAKKTKAHGISSFFHYKTIYIPSADDDSFDKADIVVFSDDEGSNEMGRVIMSPTEVEDDDLSKGYLVLRKATDHDVQRLNANKESSDEAAAACRKLIDEYELNMHLVETIYSLDGAKINFVFTSEERVDFRELVKDLAKKFQKQIHLQQIGPRDKSRFVRGYGKCGRKLCCGQVVGKLSSITMDMVRVQGMSNKGSEKLSGVCGKLMCCLSYEAKEYDNLRKNIPPMMSEVFLNDKRKGRLRGADVLNQKIRLENDGEFFSASVSDIKKFVPPKERFDDDSQSDTN